MERNEQKAPKNKRLWLILISSIILSSLLIIVVTSKEKNQKKSETLKEKQVETVQKNIPKPQKVTKKSNETVINVVD